MGGEAVYTIDLLLCVQTHIQVVVRVLSSPRAAMWFGFESKYTRTIPRTASKRSDSCGVNGKVKMLMALILIVGHVDLNLEGSDMASVGQFWFAGIARGLWRSVRGSGAWGEGCRYQ